MAVDSTTMAFTSEADLIEFQAAEIKRLKEQLLDSATQIKDLTAEVAELTATVDEGPEYVTQGPSDVALENALLQQELKQQHECNDELAQALEKASKESNELREKQEAVLKENDLLQSQLSASKRMFQVINILREGDRNAHELALKEKDKDRYKLEDENEKLREALFQLTKQLAQKNGSAEPAIAAFPELENGDESNHASPKVALQIVEDATTLTPSIVSQPPSPEHKERVEGEVVGLDGSNGVTIDADTILTSIPGVSSQPPEKVSTEAAAPVVFGYRSVVEQATLAHNGDSLSEASKVAQVTA